jgi:exopolysaccharide production protein ExoZ
MSLIVGERGDGVAPPLLARGLLARAAALYEVAGQRRVPSMEGVRGLAVLLVFFVHFDAIFKRYLVDGSPGAGVSWFLGLVGNSGVDIFFVLSGYLIYGVVIRRPVSYRAFVARRAARIYPAFLCVLAIYLALSSLAPAERRMPGGWEANGLHVLANVMLLPGLFPITPIITVAWSLSYEFFFYVSIPLLVAALGLRSSTRAGRVTWCLVTTAAGLLAALALGTHHVRLVMFVAGILLHEALASPLTLLKGRAEWIVIAAFAVAVAAQSLQAEGWEVAKVLALFLGTFWLLLYVIGGDGPASMIFRWTPLRWLGNMSYSYYLVHGLALKLLAAVVGVVAPWGHGDVWVWVVLLPLSLLVTLSVSTLLFAFVEKPWSLEPPARRPAPLVETIARIPVDRFVSSQQPLPSRRSASG